MGLAVSHRARRIGGTARGRVDDDAEAGEHGQHDADELHDGVLRDGRDEAQDAEDLVRGADEGGRQRGQGRQIGSGTIYRHQQWLIEHGISCGPSGADGFNGRETNKAIATAIARKLYA